MFRLELGDVTVKVLLMSFIDECASSVSLDTTMLATAELDTWKKLELRTQMVLRCGNDALCSSSWEPDRKVHPLTIS